MNRASRKLAAASFALSAALIVWAVGATLYMVPIWRSEIAIAGPPANLKAEELAAAHVGSLLGTVFVLIVRILVGLVIFLQGVLGLGLGLAARAMGRGRRSGRWLHLAWAILALLIELPLSWLLALHGQHETSRGLVVLSFVTAAYAFVILVLEPLWRASERGPQAGTLKKPKPFLGDFA